MALLLNAAALLLIWDVPWYVVVEIDRRIYLITRGHLITPICNVTHGILNTVEFPSVLYIFEKSRKNHEMDETRQPLGEFS